MFDYDEELPAGYQEADLLQAQYEEEGRRLDALHRRGICTHGWVLGHGHVYSLRDIEEMRQKGRFPDRRITEEDIADALDPPKGKALCLDCGKVVDDPLLAEAD